MTEEIPTEFWKEWEDADLLEQQEMVKKLFIVRDFAKTNFLGNKVSVEEKERMIATLLNSYFEDLYSYLMDKDGL